MSLQISFILSQARQDINPKHMTTPPPLLINLKLNHATSVGQRLRQFCQQLAWLHLDWLDSWTHVSKTHAQDLYMIPCMLLWIHDKAVRSQTGGRV